MIVTEIVPSHIVPFPADDSRRNDGSEIVFNGRVRSTEHGAPILALEYEHYEGMAETELNRLAEKTVSKFSIHDLFCRHRVGQIGVGEVSLHIVIWSKHRKEGLDAMTWFIAELKNMYRSGNGHYSLLVNGSPANVSIQSINRRK